MSDPFFSFFTQFGLNVTFAVNDFKMCMYNSYVGQVERETVRCVR